MAKAPAPKAAPAAPAALPDHFAPEGRYRVKVNKITRSQSFVLRPRGEYTVTGDIAEALRADLKSAEKVG